MGNAPSLQFFIKHAKLMNWKALLVSYLFSLFFAQTADCQFTYGFKAGANYSSLSLLQYENPAAYTFEQSPGFHAGAVLDKYFDEWMSVRAEFIFNARSTKYALASGTTTGSKLNFPTLAVPVLLRIKFLKHGLLLAGGQMDMRLGDVKAPFVTPKERLELGVLAGLGFETPKGFGLDVRYVHGMMPAILSPAPETARPSASDQLGFSRSIQVSLEYRFLQKEDEYYFY